MKNYLSLDQALNISGWAYYDENGSLTDYGTFQTKSSAPIEQRLGQIWIELNALYSKHEFEYMFLEECQHQSNKETYKKLSMVQGAVLLWCYFKEIPYTVLPASHWRKIIKQNCGVAFGRSRVEQKAAARKFVLDTFGKEVTEDEADAITLGYAGAIEHDKNRSAF